MTTRALATATAASCALIALAGCGSDTKTPAATPTPTPTMNGIARPDPSCVTTDGSDHHDMWDANGWWAGRVDGIEKQMGSFAVLKLKLDGHDISSAWICASRPQG